MTNREWLNTLSSREFAYFVINNLPDIGRGWNDSVSGVAIWLDEPHNA